VKCDGKGVFDCRADAEKAAKRTRENGYGRSMHAYRCDCGKFHVGHARTKAKQKKFRFKMRRH
jgi:hypothetical protein